MIFFDVVVCVPLLVAGAAARDDYGEPHATLDQSSGHETAAAVVVGRLAADAVQIERGLRFPAEVKNLRCLGLHLERQIVGRDASGLLRVSAGQRGFIELPD
jgi:hypothetical protein